MIKNLLLFALLSFSLVFFGCSKKNEQPVKKDSEKQVNNNENKNDNDENGGDETDMEKDMKEFKKMMTGNSKVEVVNFRELKALLPESIGDLKRTSASGEKTNSFGIKVSLAKGKYILQSEGENKNITIKITDMGSIKGAMGMAAFAWSMAEIDKETDTGFERTFEYKGHKAHEEYDTKYNNGKVQVLVAKRFIVEIDGSNVSWEMLREALNSVPIDELESKKNEGIEEE